MRIVVVGPGHDYATNATWRALIEALEAEGHDVIPYDTGIRYDMAQVALAELWRQGRMKDGPDLPDILAEAGNAAYVACISNSAEAVIVITGVLWHPDHTLFLRRAGMVVGIYHTEGPYLDDAPVAVNLRYADVVWVNERCSVAGIQQHFDKRWHPPVYYLPHGYDPSRHQPVDGDPAVPQHDVVFVGSGFEERIRLLEAVDWRGIDLGLYGHWALLDAPFRVTRGKEASGLSLAMMRMARFLPHSSPLWRYVRGWITPWERTAALYRRARIGLNLFRSSVLYERSARHVTGAESMGPRLYELAACGCFILSERRPEVAEVFGDLVPTFDDADSMVRGIRYYLDRPDERRRITELLPEVVRKHSWRTRAQQVVHDLKRAESARLLVDAA